MNSLSISLTTSLLLTLAMPAVSSAEKLARNLAAVRTHLIATPKVIRPERIEEGVVISTHSANGRVPIRSWKTLRDERIVKQNLDFSCGAASLATLLASYYGQDITEEALLIAMDKGNGRASFEDMVRGLSQFGFRAQGFAVNWEQLTRLKMPVVLYVKHDKNEHFTVLRGISNEVVWLADPSLGNRTFSREQFLAMWQTRLGADDGLAGKFLAVLPANPGITSLDDFFTKTPRRQSASAKTYLASRVQP